MISNAWYFYYALPLVFMAVYGGFDITFLSP
ncbi:DUF3265 domain-containing protein [Plesiomonas shigelloides]|nr:DUF3265 domain-containing protein [Plesiomonas shigelloides]